MCISLLPTGAARINKQQKFPVAALNSFFFGWIHEIMQLCELGNMSRQASSYAPVAEQRR